MNVDKNNAEIFHNLNTNFWITANAGSGKTTQLVNRFLFLLKSGIKPEEIVCITYTLAAAKEIKDRVLKIARENNFNVKEDQLNIFTIHSFCRKLLIANRLLDDNCEILNNNEFLFEKIIKEIVNEIDDNNDLLKIDQYLEEQGLKIIDELAKIKTIVSFYELIKSIINNQLWFFSLFDRVCNSDSVDVINCIEIDKIYKLLPKDLQCFAKNNLEIFRENNELQKELVRRDLVEDLVKEIIDKGILNRSKKIKERFVQNNVIDYDFLKNLDNWEDIVLTSDKSPRKDVKKCELFVIKRIQKYFLDKNCQKSVNVTYSILCFAFVVLKMYQNIKGRMNINTYDDLLFQAFKAMSGNYFFDKNICNNGSNIKHLMLDEAQDTNPISWKIIKGIVETTKCNFFIVGDKKQSIYRFQGARVEEYEKNRGLFADISRDLGVSFNFDVKLNMSFRSIMPILDEADKLCNDSSESKSAFTTDKNEVIKHYCCEEKLDKQPNGYILNKNNAVFFENFDLSSDCDDEESCGEVNGDKSKWLVRTEKLYQKQKERKQKIHNIAERLYKYILANKCDVDNNVIEKSEGFSNGVAIVFSHKGFGDKFIFDLSAELQNHYGIDVITKTDIEKCTIYYDDIVSILSFFVLQNDNMNLACLLKSEIFCFTDAMLTQLCLSCDDFSIENTLWKSLKQQVFPIKEEERKRKFAVDALCEVLKCQSLTEVLNEVEKIIANVSFANKKCKKYFRSLNLIKEYADKYREEFDYDMRSFLLALNTDSSQDDRVYLPGADNCEKSVLKVFFSTIHGVKGMEFDTVLYFDVEQKASNKEDDKMMFFDDCFWYKTGGLKVKKYAEYNSSFRELRSKIEQQDLQDRNEKLRLKYVAITRAKRRIIYFSFN